MRWKMKPVENRLHLDFPASLQEEFAGVEARVVVAKSPKGEPSRDIESLPLAAKRLGDFVRGRILAVSGSAFEPRSPRGRRCAEPVEAWRSCLSHC